MHFGCTVQRVMPTEPRVVGSSIYTLPVPGWDYCSHRRAHVTGTGVRIPATGSVSEAGRH